MDELFHVTSDGMLHTSLDQLLGASRELQLGYGVVFRYM